jgi:hypothetical protein
MGDVENAENSIDHGQAKGNQGIDATHSNSIGELLPNHITSGNQ